MNITLRQESIVNEPLPLAVVGICQDEPLSEKLAALLEVDDFQGKPKQTALLYPRGDLAPRRVLLIGLGKYEELHLDTIRRAAAIAGQKAHQCKVTELGIHFPTPEDTPPSFFSQAVVEGIELGLYRFLDYKSHPKPEETHCVEKLLLFLEGEQESLQQGIDIAQAIVKGVTLARNLANAPGNVVTPAYLGEVAQDIGSRMGLKVSVLSGEELKNFGGLMAVGQGSAQPPRFIILEHMGAQTEEPPICLVGKGITFDTGGISIKPSDKMDEMKMDMSGAAAVLGTMQVISELQLPLHVIGLISAAENMPSATAYKPGDIIKTLSGKTIEVLNTDAEGRIILADALFYAQQYKPQAIVNIATLTGAIGIALGPHAIGLFGNNQALIDHVLKAGESTHERAWQLPLWDEYKEMIKSDFADLKNIGGRPAGSITAAAFLSAFVGDYPWAHLDIASTAWTDKPCQEYHTKGATGIGVRLFVHMLRDWGNF